MSLQTRLENLERFYNVHQGEEILSIISFNREQFKLDKLSVLKETIKEYQDKDKLLRIGIVGRVKAGKSSLLNALLFDGEDILPKAATPMTAALTIMKYSEKTYAEVDFFEEKDIQELKKEHDDHLNFKADRLKEEREEEANKPANKQDFSKAEKRAERKAKDSPYIASFDQYERIANSGVSVANLNQYKTIESASVQELNCKLADFVGAEGKYMPFTKSVTLHLPEKGLQGVEIVDTPGVNDPVQSRGKRTEDLLSQCDVVLVVSPSGQFLSEQDMDLMMNLTNSKGKSEIYLVASQCDTQLFGSEYAGLSLSEVLSKMKQTLAKHARTTLEAKPGLKPVLARFNPEDLMLTSGVCYSLAKRLNEKPSFGGDETLSHSYNLLKNSYGAQFAQPEGELQVLNQLANLDKVNEVLAQVRSRSSEILRENFANYEKKQLDVFSQVIGQSINDVDNKISLLKQNDLSSLAEQKKQMEILKGKVKNVVAASYAEHVAEFLSNLERDLDYALDKQISQFKQGREEEGYNERKVSERVKVGVRDISCWWNPFTWGDTENIYETVYRTERDYYTYVNVTPIRNSIEKVLESLENELQQSAEEKQTEFKNGLMKDLPREISNAEQKSEIESRILDRQLVEQTLKTVLARLPRSRFDIDSLPVELDKSGKLIGDAGTQYMSAAQRYVRGLKVDISRQIRSYISSLETTLDSIQLDRHFIEAYQEQIEQLETDVRNKEEILAK